MKIYSDTRFIWYLSCIGFFAIFSTTISKNPVLPLFAQSMGAGDVTIGLISAVSPLAGILFSFPVGVLSDALGRRRILLTAGAVFFIAPLLYLLVSDPLWLIPIRFFHGTATAILGPVMSAVIAGRFTRTRGERLGQYSSATLIGRTLAPVMGGIILAVSLWPTSIPSYQAVYLCAAASAVPVVILLLMFKDERDISVQTIRVSRFIRSLHTFISDRRLSATALVDLGTYFAFGAFETFIPIYLIRQHLSPWLIGVIFSAQVLVIAGTKPFFGRYADQTDERYQIIGGLLLIAIVELLIPVFDGFFPLLAVSLLFGIGMSLTTVATSTYVAYLAKEKEIGASMGALSSIMDIGHSGGPFITGIIIALFGYLAGFGLCGVLMLVISVIFWIRVREEREGLG